MFGRILRGESGTSPPSDPPQKDCISCKALGCTVCFGTSAYFYAFAQGSFGEVLGKPPAGAHRFATLAFVGGFAALGVARAVV
mmetsp:Transcript_36474/g.115051  ORF Transcript_36474/g.115051 Transcript_36474/m.115051 type:complete len:83 (-) Transcript_36474:361-609(-)